MEILYQLPVIWSQLYNSAKNFLSYGTGYALCRGDHVISEAYASIGGGHAEIGVITHPDYRGKGCASFIVSHLMQKCRKERIEPIWSCQIHNRSSLNTGLKLGFYISNYYMLMVPTVGNVLGPGLANWLKTHKYP